MDKFLKFVQDNRKELKRTWRYDPVMAVVFVFVFFWLVVIGLVIFVFLINITGAWGIMAIMFFILFFRWAISIED